MANHPGQSGSGYWLAETVTTRILEEAGRKTREPDHLEENFARRQLQRTCRVIESHEREGISGGGDLKPKEKLAPD